MSAELPKTGELANISRIETHRSAALCTLAWFLPFHRVDDAMFSKGSVFVAWKTICAGNFSIFAQVAPTRLFDVRLVLTLMCLLLAVRFWHTSY